MSAREPSEWAVREARHMFIYGACKCDAGGVCALHRDIADAFDAVEQRGFSRAVNETAIASIHKAVAAERAAVVAWLRRVANVGRVATADDYADEIEAGDHHPKEGA